MTIYRSSLEICALHTEITFMKCVSQMDQSLEWLPVYEVVHFSFSTLRSLRRFVRRIQPKQMKLSPVLLTLCKLDNSFVSSRLLVVGKVTSTIFAKQPKHYKTVAQILAS